MVYRYQAPAGGKPVVPAATGANANQNPRLVPQVTSAKAEQAQAKLVGMGFKVNTVFVDTPDQTRNGYVAQQTPAAGQQAQPGSIVTLQVYRFKNQMVAMPQVTAVKAEQAQGKLVGMGFKVSTAFIDTPDQSRNGYVAQQTPAAGQQVQPGSTVALQVYRFKNQMVAVPQVTAVKAEQAQGQLAGMGFKVSTTFVDTPDQSRNGVVAKQTPAAGQQAQPGSVVSLQVYRAKAK
jgi:serine/threonine-protein kinase